MLPCSTRQRPSSRTATRLPLGLGYGFCVEVDPNPGGIAGGVEKVAEIDAASAADVEHRSGMQLRGKCSKCRTEEWLGQSGSNSDDRSIVRVVGAGLVASKVGIQRCVDGVVVDDQLLDHAPKVRRATGDRAKSTATDAVPTAALADLPECHAQVEQRPEEVNVRDAGPLCDLTERPWLVQRVGNPGSRGHT